MGKRGALPGMGGRPRKALMDKILEGNPGKRPLTVIQMPTIEGSKMPEPREYLSAQQKNGGDFFAKDIYKKTWEWLKKRSCENLVTSQILEQYAVSAARWIQCEQAISELGFLVKSLSNGGAIPSPYVSISHSYLKQTNHIWSQIYQIVRENCSEEYEGKAPHDDMMEQLLTKRKAR